MAFWKCLILNRLTNSLKFATSIFINKPFYVQLSYILNQDWICRQWNDKIPSILNDI